MLIKVRYISNSTIFISPQHVIIRPHPFSKLPIFSPNFFTINGCPKLQKHAKSGRNYVHRDEERGVSPADPPPIILSWIVAVAIAMAIPFIGYKWGPTLKRKVETVMQTTEDVAETVEKVATEVEKAAEEIAERLPAGGKLRGAVVFIEKIAERTARDAGAVDDFIDMIQNNQEKLESVIKPKTHLDESKNATITKAREEKTATTIIYLSVEESTKAETPVETQHPKQNK